MGEGKTQIIIPMITLELLFGDAKKARIPRVNLLNSLFSESKFNYFRFLSATAFNVAIVELPFDRSVDLEDPFVNQKISLSLNHFKDRMMLLLDQSSTHSMILKLRECAIKAIEEERLLDSEKEKAIFRNVEYFDVFDEVDAQMHPKKSFVYSIGASSQLDEAEFRAEVCIAFLDALCSCLPELCENNLVAFDETETEARTALSEGRFPKGYRYISSIAEQP